MYVYQQTDVSHFQIALYGQVIQSGRRYRRLLSYMTPLSDGTPAHICIHFIFLASKIIGLHFATNDIGLSSFNLFLVRSVRRFYFKERGVSAVQRHPRSLILVPIKSAHVTSYYPVVVTLVLSCTTLEI